MINEIEKLTQEYFSWLQDKTILKQLKDWVEITTPYLDRHNDYIQIYVKKDNNKLILTDDGYIISDLIQSGCDLDTPKRRDLLKTTLNGFGVEQEGEELFVYSTPETFALKKHNLIQALLAVNDLFYLATTTITNLFLEEVIEWLDYNDIRYIPNTKLAGDSGYDHTFDFAIPKSKKYPERLLRAINAPKRDNAVSFTFAWIDTKKIRYPNTMAFSILNDQEHNISSPVIEALDSYDITPVHWTRRNDFVERLVN